MLFRSGRVFSAFKFRTMVVDAEAKIAEIKRQHGSGAFFKAKDDPRITRVGKWLRRFSLDEFPQFLNVVRGEMSVVGPRPLLMRYLPLYDTFQARRMEVKPGVTGWAQVNGRNALSWEQKFAYDVWYVDHRGFWLDLKIIALTFFKVFARSGINSDKAATMEEFRGTGKG